MANNIRVNLPLLNTNEQTVFIVNWAIENGTYVSKNTTLAEIESSKSVEELLSPSDGYFYSLVDANKIYEVGTCVAIITDQVEFDISQFEIIVNKSENQDVILTDKARKLLDELKIDISLLPKDILLKEDDIRKFAGEINIGIISSYHKILHDVLNGINNPSNAILIVGAGTGAKIIIETILSAQKYNIIGIVDKEANKYNKILGIPIIGYNDKDILTEIFNAGVTLACNSVISLYNIKTRELVYEKLKDIGFTLPSIIHPRAYVENSAVLDEGVFVHANSYIGAECHIGENTFINTSAVISHDCKIGKTVFCAPNSVIAGLVEIGDRCVIGMCSTILSRVKLGNDVFVNNGTNVITDVPNGSHLVNTNRVEIKNNKMNSSSKKYEGGIK